MLSNMNNSYGEHDVHTPPQIWRAIPVQILLPKAEVLKNSIKMDIFWGKSRIIANNCGYANFLPEELTNSESPQDASSG